MLPLAIIASPTNPDDVMTSPPEDIETYLDLWVKWTRDMATVEREHSGKIYKRDYNKVEEIVEAVKANVESRKFFSSKCTRRSSCIGTNAYITHALSLPLQSCALVQSFALLWSTKSRPNWDAVWLGNATCSRTV